MADGPDAKRSRLSLGIEESPIPEERQPADEGEDDVDGPIGGSSKYVYNMTYGGKSLFVIINNEKFDRSTGMGPRTGSNVDAAELYQRFNALGFDVKHYPNLKVVEMLKLMANSADADHSNANCFGCAILSHGEEGLVYGTDGSIEIDKLVEPFKGQGAATLAGKPKIFIIQACRGDKYDEGRTVQGDAMSDDEADSPQKKYYRIPTEADFIYAYSTVPGYYAWRNSVRGSWFIQALCKMLKLHGDSKDLMWILTRVNHEVAYDFESNSRDPTMHRKKQIPSIVSMLTKDLYFNVK